ncbi:MAG: hypothetical protein AB4206_17215 [Xenococcaceae cyanobacterium]
MIFQLSRSSPLELQLPQHLRWLRIKIGGIGNPKRRCEVSLTGHIGHKGWEKIYLWLLDRIAHAHQLKGTEDL